ncbi:hypothetical protein FB451DRAFT_1406618 [Mycena latifolia]|nr:hypothetical protein FB451DRAFT_1406618 [Mycena latifolia]
MRTALEMLGYKDTHYMQNVLANPIEADFWRHEARGEWHIAVTDVPANLFSEELIAAYPDATTFSCSERVARARAVDPVCFGKVMGFTTRCGELMVGTTAAEAQEESTAQFKVHYEGGKAMVPPEWLLEVEVGKGWERLCGFLGEEVQQLEEAFSHTNDAKTIRENVDASAARIWRDEEGPAELAATGWSVQF